MENNNKKFEMTDFDLFMQSKVEAKKPTNEKSVFEFEQTKAKEKISNNNEYRQYMLSQLQCRTDAKILSEEDFLATDKTMESNVDSFVQKKKKNTVESKFNFTTNGKILLGLYVIILIACASIILVLTASRENGYSLADAQNNIIESSRGGNIKGMLIEEKEYESDNFFDFICDKLNK